MKLERVIKLLLHVTGIKRIPPPAIRPVVAKLCFLMVNDDCTTEIDYANLTLPFGTPTYIYKFASQANLWAEVEVVTHPRQETARLTLGDKVYPLNSSEVAAFVKHSKAYHAARIAEWNIREQASQNKIIQDILDYNILNKK